MPLDLQVAESSFSSRLLTSLAAIVCLAPPSSSITIVAMRRHRSSVTR
ncbi:hypothetical protein A2U01_0063036, partial [Trifolium medium]|nr:hypothetical protein [Trifolium medium]